MPFGFDGLSNLTEKLRGMVKPPMSTGAPIGGEIRATPPPAFMTGGNMFSPDMLNTDNTSMGKPGMGTTGPNLGMGMPGGNMPLPLSSVPPPPPPTSSVPPQSTLNPTLPPPPNSTVGFPTTRRAMPRPGAGTIGVGKPMPKKPGAPMMKKRLSMF